MNQFGEYDDYDRMEKEGCDSLEYLYKKFRHFFNKRLYEVTLQSPHVPERVLRQEGFENKAQEILNIIEDMEKWFSQETSRIPVVSWKENIEISIEKCKALKEFDEGNGFDFTQGKYKGLENFLGIEVTSSGTIPMPFVPRKE